MADFRNDGCLSGMNGTPLLLTGSYGIIGTTCNKGITQGENMAGPRVFLFAAAVALLTAFAAQAQTTQRIRGTITGMEGNTLSIKTREGKDIKVDLTEKATVATAKAITLTDLKQGDYVGSTTRQRQDGALVALEVHVLPRTAPEGHTQWDLEPNTMMTNANVESMVQAVGGQELVLKYKDGSQKILVPPGTPIVTTVPADRSSLKVGEYVFMGANVAPDGAISTSARIQVSKDGVKPPQ